jgi:very-short-patch-repair endonuclease
MNWTDKDIIFLIDNKEKGSKWCYENLKRTKNSVLSKAKKLGIKFSKIKMSDETKNKISSSMKNAHLEKRHPGWAFINLSKDRRSYPEVFFIEVFKANKLFEKFKIEEKFHYHKYFIDFLFVDIKLIIEIDGSQHFRTKESIEHDLERDKFFLEEGFKIYRIKWLDVIKNSKYEIDMMLEFISNIDHSSYRKYEISDLDYKRPSSDSKCKCGKIINKKSSQCKSCKSLSMRKVSERPDLETLKHDIKNLGFSATGRKYGVSDNSIRKWIKV